MKIVEPLSRLKPLPYLLLALAVFAAYASVYPNAFLLDDFVIIVQNDFLRQWSSLPDLLSKLSLKGSGLNGGFYRPAQMLLYFFMYQTFGLSEAAFHGLNVLLQAVNAGLVFLLGCRLNLRPQAAFAAALLWGVHPLWSESVACASGTADMLFGLFSLTGILVLLPDFSPRRVWLSCLLLLLALGSKESAVVFPALATFTLFLVSKDRLRPATYLRLWPLWLLAVAYLVGWLMCPVLSTLELHDPLDTPYVELYQNNIVNRILTTLATLPVYLGLLLWPAGLHMERSFPVFTSPWSWQVLAGAAMVALALLQIGWGRGRRGVALTWGLLWFAAAHAPNTGILKPINALLAEHWLYLPTIGLFIGIAQTATAWLDSQKSKRAPMIVAALVLLAALGLGAKTYFQTKIWRDAVSFYGNIFANGEKSGRAHNSLGQYYFNMGNYEKAAEHFHATIEHPAPMWVVKTSLTHFRLALIALNARPDENGMITVDEIRRVLPLAPPAQISEAVKRLETVLTLDPNDYWADQFLGALREYLSGKEKAASPN